MKQSILFSLMFISTYAQDLINSGPMVGYSSMQEVLLWVQTEERANVHFEYYEVENPKIRYKTNCSHYSFFGHANDFIHKYMPF